MTETKTDRNREIARRYHAGASAPALAVEYEISHQRVFQILKNQGVETDFRRYATLHPCPRCGKMFKRERRKLGPRSYTTVSHLCAACRTPAAQVEHRYRDIVAYIPDDRFITSTGLAEQFRLHRVLKAIGLLDEHGIATAVGKHPVSVTRMVLPESAERDERVSSLIRDGQGVGAIWYAMPDLSFDEMVLSLAAIGAKFSSPLTTVQRDAEVARAHLQGATQDLLAEQFSLSRQTISSILRRQKKA
ncbi:MAG TPA: hypothetical protein DDW52_06760 [Planctomycetaceae bacterium]|nr:hypothetical protein [Planctomycetaceae bacterium]